jgi:RNA polymerase sigma factor (sigma-70 family)
MTPSRSEAGAPLVDFADLYREHARHVRRFALFLSGDAALSDDLVSETFVRVWTARDRVDLTTVRGYLFAIVRNLFLDHVRHARRSVSLDERLPTGRRTRSIGRAISATCAGDRTLARRRDDRAAVRCADDGLLQLARRSI